jgi:hypothetical protein
MMYPGRAGYPVVLTEPFDGGSTEGGPPQGVESRQLWESERISNELLVVSSGRVKPPMQEMPNATHGLSP